MRLGKNQICPLHRSLFCCGRERQEKVAFAKGVTQHGPVTRIPDFSVPRGYREVCTPAELRRRKDIKIREQQGVCALCHEPMTDYRDVELDHIIPQPAGCKKDSHLDNLQAVHHACNMAKGSQRF
jgi:5-methylcytosine-specific restriction endonuclease McrA